MAQKMKLKYLDDDDVDGEGPSQRDVELWNRLYKDNNIVIQSLKTITKVQQAIASILTKVDEDRMHGKMCSLLGLSKLLTSLSSTETSINPSVLKDQLTSLEEATNWKLFMTPKKR